MLRAAMSATEPSSQRSAEDENYLQDNEDDYYEDIFVSNLIRKRTSQA